MPSRPDPHEGEIERIKIPGDWYSIDFHVHSPASRDFKGPEIPAQEGKEEKLYIWLLGQAVEAKLDAIAITDHNEIKGYRKLCELEADLRSTERTLARGGLAIPEDVQRQLNLFDSLIVLPGVELDTKLGVHYLILFDPHRSVEEMEDFLVRGGFPEDRRNQESASQYASWDVQDTCHEAEKLGAIAIAAHVDSSNGLYEITKHLPGHVRIASFKDSCLFGMEFNNPAARDQIESLFKQPQYERDTRLAFVQSSDFHGRTDQRIGERRTWVRLDNVRHDSSDLFRLLKEALRNPDEYVNAPGRPELREILRRLSDKPALKCVDTEADINTFLEYVCAFANSGDGTIALGRNEKGSWVGVECMNSEDITNRLSTLIRDNIKPIPQFEIEVYPYYDDKYFATVGVRKQTRIHVTTRDDRVYFLEQGKPQRASTSQVVYLVEENFVQRYAHLSITNRLARMSERLGGTRDSLDILPLVRRIEKQTIAFSQIFPHPQVGEKATVELEAAIECKANGVPHGEAIVIVPELPRRKEQYIRLTARMGTCDLSKPPVVNLKRFNGDKLVIAPKGAVFFDAHDDIIAICDQWAPLVCLPSGKYGSADIRFLAGYLKSAIPIWFADRCLGSTDIRNERILRSLPIPYEPPTEFKERVLKIVDQLMSLESNFLEQEQSALKRQPTDEDQSKREFYEEIANAVEAHNHAAGKIMAQLDKMFFELFSLTQNEIAIVQQGVLAAGFVIFERPDE